jgi:tricorn protease
VRGKLFSFPLWEGAVRQHGTPDGVRYRLARWLADGKTLVAVSDEKGEERLQVFAESATRTLDADIGRVVAMEAAPDREPCRGGEPSQRSAAGRRRIRGGRR